jgi:hypothetical protein
MSLDEVFDLMMGGGGSAFPFDNIGDTVTGEIISMENRAQTEEDGSPKTFSNG